MGKLVGLDESCLKADMNVSDFSCVVFGYASVHNSGLFFIYLVSFFNCCISEYFNIIIIT